MTRRQLVCAAEIGEFFRVDPGDGWIFIVTHRLAGGDLPDAVASKPRISYVITGREVLAKDGFGFIEIVTQDGGVTVNEALRLRDLDRA